MVNDFDFQNSEGKSGKSVKFQPSDFEKILKDIRQKNGFVFATMYMPGFVRSLEKLKARCEKLVDLIDEDLKK